MGSPKPPARSAPPPAPAPVGLTDILSKMTESLTLIQSQLATQATTQAAVNKSLEDKIAKLQSQVSRGHNSNRDQLAAKPHSGGPIQRSTTVFTYCGIPGHTAKKCYKKERADKAAGKAAAPPPSVQRPSAAYITDDQDAEPRGVRYLAEGAFMALSEHSTSAPTHNELPTLAEATNLPSIVTIPPFEFYFSDPSNVVRYLGLCCGASMHIIRTLVSRGRFLAELYLCDKDPSARKVALATLQKIVHGSPDSFAPSLRVLILQGTLFE